MNKIETENAQIESTALGFPDRGIFTCWLYLTYDGGGQGFGGYALDTPLKDDKGKFLRRVGIGFGIDFISEILRTVGVEKWEDLPGKYIRVRREHTKVHAIGNIIADEWFSPEELAHKAGLREQSVRSPHAQEASADGKPQ